MHPHSRLLVGLLAACLSAPAVVTAQVEPPSPQDAAAIVEFSARVHAYSTLHRRLEGPVATIDVSEDPDEITTAIDALGDAIRAARVDAKQGDIFTPQAAALFRRVIRESFGGRFRELIAMTHEETPPLGRPTVNGRWPGTSYTFMPPNLLRLFPPLPEDLEYRFVNRDLVLWDSHANVIVDVISDAIPLLTPVTEE